MFWLLPPALRQQHLPSGVWSRENQVYSSAAEMKQPAVRSAVRFAGDLLRTAWPCLRRTGVYGSPVHTMIGLLSIPHQAFELSGLCSGAVLSTGPKDRLEPEAAASGGGGDGTHQFLSPDLITPMITDLCRASGVQVQMSRFAGL